MPDQEAMVWITLIALALLGLVGAINEILHLIDRLRKKPPPAGNYTADLAVEAEAFRRANHQRGEDVKILHREIEDGLDELRILLKADVERINDRIDATPARLILLLRKTRGLIK